MTCIIAHTILKFGLWDYIALNIHYEDQLHPPSYTGTANYNLISLGAKYQSWGKATPAN